MKKHLISITLALALVLSLVPGVSAQSLAFWDTHRGDWFAGYVYALANAGIVDGMEPELYVPSGAVTRAQLIKLMAASTADAKALQAARDAGTFRDVTKDDWYAPYVNWSAAHGIAEGYPGDVFLPDQQVTRAEAAAFVARFAKASDDVTLKTDAQEIAFTDAASIPDWARDAVTACVRGGIFDGYEDGTFRPGANMTRAESAAILCRLLGIEPLAESEIPNAAQPQYISTTIAGCSVQAVVFPLNGYSGRIVLAKDHLFRVEQAASILRRGDAYIGANGAFFDMNDLTTYGNLVIDGEPVRIENNSPEGAPHLVISNSGAVSIEFMRPEMSVSRMYHGAEVARTDGAALNRVPYDPDGPAKETVVYTAMYGDKVPAGYTRVAVCAPDGTVTAFYDAEAVEPVDPTPTDEPTPSDTPDEPTPSDTPDEPTPSDTPDEPTPSETPEDPDAPDTPTESSEPTPTVSPEPTQTEPPEPTDKPEPEPIDMKNIAIPAEGFVVAEHGKDAKLLRYCAVGDILNVKVRYAGSATQDIRAALGCGPTVVKNGQPYGSRETYIAEGYPAYDIVSASAMRIAVGVRPDGSVVFATTTCKMGTLGQIMYELGCKTAMNLDGGASTTLQVGVNTVQSPGRRLNTMILFSFT